MKRWLSVFFGLIALQTATVVVASQGQNSVVFGEEVLSGSINEDTTLVPGIYQMQDSVTVQEGSTLTLEPGVQINTDFETKLLVKGTLIIAGTKDVPVILGSEYCEFVDWQGIEVVVGATVNIEYAGISCAYQGVFFNGGEGSVKHSKLFDNDTAIVIGMEGAEEVVAPQVIEENEIRRNEYGIVVVSNSAPQITSNNEITDNGYGLYILGSDPSGEPQIAGTVNEIFDTEYSISRMLNIGLSVIKSNKIADASFGTYVLRKDKKSLDPKPIVTGNSLYDNYYANYYADYFYNPDSVTLNATGNWWGTTKFGDIVLGLHDRRKSDYTPVIDYSGYLDGPGGQPVPTGEIFNGPIDRDITLVSGSYDMPGDVTVKVGSTLTLDAGVQLNIAPFATLKVEGSLIIAGTELLPVILQSAASVCLDPGRELSIYWGGIEVIAEATAKIEYAEISCASNGVFFNAGEGSVKHSKLFDNDAAILIGSEVAGVKFVPQITDENEIRNNEYGIVIFLNGAALITGNNEITENYIGISVEGSLYQDNKEALEPNPIVTGNRLYDNHGYNYDANGFETPDSIILNATGNWWGTKSLGEILGKIHDGTDSDDAPIVDYSGYLNGPGGEPVPTGEVLDGSIDGDKTLGEASHEIRGNVTVKAGSTLTLNSGAELNIAPGVKLRVKGALVIAGTESSPVVMRPYVSDCNDVSRERDDWDGIKVLAGGTVNIEYAEIHCAEIGVNFNNGDGSIKHSKLLNNNTAIQTEAASAETAIAPQITDMNIIRGSEYGIYVGVNSAPVITGNNEITDNDYG
ncbi:MAG: hypothetical protein K0U59_03050, partial [Gammaproteobacteria bacterium]|nr:hypothetical protein [Gammaproteobacteria bacterium]